MTDNKNSRQFYLHLLRRLNIVLPLVIMLPLILNGAPFMLTAQITVITALLTAIMMYFDREATVFRAFGVMTLYAGVFLPHATSLFSICATILLNTLIVSLFFKLCKIRFTVIYLFIASAFGFLFFTLCRLL